MVEASTWQVRNRQIYVGVLWRVEMADQIDGSLSFLAWGLAEFQFQGWLYMYNIKSISTGYTTGCTRGGEDRGMGRESGQSLRG
jgi:hypothetical protein